MAATSSSFNSGKNNNNNHEREKLNIRDRREPGWYHVDNELYECYESPGGPKQKVYDMAVYNALARHVNIFTQVGWPSLTSIANKLHISRNQVIKSVGQLEKAGWIKKYHQSNSDPNKKDKQINYYALLSVKQLYPQQEPNQGQGSAPGEPGVVHWVNQVAQEVSQLVHTVSYPSAYREPASSPGEPGVVHTVNEGSSPGEPELDSLELDLIKDSRTRKTSKTKNKNSEQVAIAPVVLGGLSPIREQGEQPVDNSLMREGLSPQSTILSITPENQEQEQVSPAVSARVIGPPPPAHTVINTAEVYGPRPAHVDRMEWFNGLIKRIANGAGPISEKGNKITLQAVLADLIADVYEIKAPEPSLVGKLSKELGKKVLHREDGASANARETRDFILEHANRQGQIEMGVMAYLFGCLQKKQVQSETTSSSSQGRGSGHGQQPQDKVIAGYIIPGNKVGLWDDPSRLQSKLRALAMDVPLNADEASQTEDERKMFHAILEELTGQRFDPRTGKLLVETTAD